MLLWIWCNCKLINMYLNNRHVIFNLVFEFDPPVIIYLSSVTFFSLAWPKVGTKWTHRSTRTAKAKSSFKILSNANEKNSQCVLVITCFTPQTAPRKYSKIMTSQRLTKGSPCFVAIEESMKQILSSAEDKSTFVWPPPQRIYSEHEALFLKYFAQDKWKQKARHVIKAIKTANGWNKHDKANSCKWRGQNCQILNDFFNLKFFMTNSSLFILWACTADAIAKGLGSPTGNNPAVWFGKSPLPATTSASKPTKPGGTPSNPPPSSNGKTGRARTRACSTRI